MVHNDVLKLTSHLPFVEVCVGSCTQFNDLAVLSPGEFGLKIRACIKRKVGGG